MSEATGNEGLPRARSWKQARTQYFLFLLSGSLAGGLCVFVGQIVGNAGSWVWYCVQHEHGIRFDETMTMLRAIAIDAISSRTGWDVLSGLIGGVSLGGPITGLVCLTWKKVDCVLGTALFWCAFLPAVLHATVFLAERTYRWPGLFAVVALPLFGTCYGLSVALMVKLLRRLMRSRIS